MTKVELEIYDNAVECLNKCANIKDSGIEIVIPVGSVLFENVLNLKLIKSYLGKNSITANFSTEDVEGQNIIELAENGEISEMKTSGMGEETIGKQSSKPLKLPNIKNMIKLPKLQFKLAGLPTIVGGIIVLALILGFVFLQKTHKAYVKIIVNSQPLTRSITLKVKKDVVTDTEQKILKGTAVDTTYEGTLAIDTTGTKEVGDKAKGEVIIYNKTTTEKTFKKGTVLEYKGGITFTLDEEVTVVARTEDLVPTPPTVTYGEKNVKVTAVTFGKESNIEKDVSIEFDDYKKDDYSAKAKSDFSGGTTKTVKVVAAADTKTLSENLQKLNQEEIQKALDRKSIGNQKFIKGSEKLTITKESYSNKEAEEATKLTLVQAVSATGLSYSNMELNSLMDKLTQNLVPEGYVISTKDKEIKVEVLGQSTNSVLTTLEADIQITLKTYVVPSINEENLKKELGGKNTAEAQKIIGGIKNIKTYEFKLVPAFSLLNKVPTDPTKIELTIEKE